MVNDTGIVDGRSHKPIGKRKRVNKAKSADLTLQCALVLISEMSRFWTDDQIDLSGKLYPARIDYYDIPSIKRSVKEIDRICKIALRKAQEETEK